MKLILACSILTLLLAAAASAESLDTEEAETIVQSGEVMGSRSFTQPTLGWELLIRHNGGLYICSIVEEMRYGYNGNPNVQYVKNQGCTGTSQSN